MRANNIRALAVIGVLASALLACNYATSLLAGKSDTTILKDDFSSDTSRWGTGTDADSSVEYMDGGLHMKVFKANFFTWSNPGHDPYQDVHMEVTVKNDNGDKRAGFGLVCNQQEAKSSYYYFAVTSDGEYVIGKSEESKDDVFLTNNNAWGSSDAIARQAPSYRIAADCAAGHLALYVNGTKVDSASDTSYDKGAVGLFLWSGEEPVGEVTYDDFVMTSLAAKK